MVLESKNRGLFVVVMDMSETCLARPNADAFVCENISSTSSIIEVAKTWQIDAIVSMITEAGIVSGQEACEILNLPFMCSAAGARATLSKVAMRSEFDRCGFPNIPNQKIDQMEQVGEFAEKHGFNLILKRSSGGGQRNMHLIRSKQDLENLRQSQIDLKNYIAERIIEGPEVNGVCTFRKSEIQDVVISDRITEPGAFGIVKEHRYPSSLSAAQYLKIKQLCEQLKGVLGIHDGVVFPQFLIDESTGDPWLVELGVRIPGGKMDRLFYHATGVDLVTFCLDIALGELKDYEHYRTGHVSAVVHVTFMNGPPGPLKEGLVDKFLIPDRNDYPPEVVEHGLFGQTQDHAIIRSLSNGAARFYYCVGVGSSALGVNQGTASFFSQVDFIDAQGSSLKAKPLTNIIHG